MDIHLWLITVTVILLQGYISMEPDSNNYPIDSTLSKSSSYNMILYNVLICNGSTDRDVNMTVLCAPKLQISNKFWKYFFFNKRRPTLSCTSYVSEESPDHAVKKEETTTSPQDLDLSSSSEDINTIDEFRRFLGNNSKLIYNDNGRFVGIAPDYPDSTGDTGASVISDQSVSPTNYPDPFTEQGNNRMSASSHPTYPHQSSYPKTFRPVDKSVNQAQSEVEVNTDVCCSTWEVYYVNTTLTDVRGITQTIAQFDNVGSYQFIRHGFCGHRGLCTGVCFQEYVTMSLAIYPPARNRLTSFSFFYIPAYCTCKIRQSQGR